ncbi:hypothetical protein INT48_002279 [Thamnidium elegans]|uniref:Uncharacterized protein n=1 Tax=Thamnidium elegans TaxID=101142 RepID=A0A8H7SLW5_9FUNG|nr:hypothetical protein INT48_002279 [Thamnidium elegans]
MNWFNHFNGIFTQGFVTGSGTHSISGPLAVKDQWISPNYGVNIKNPIDCNDNTLTPLDKMGLIVDAISAIPINITVNGNIHVPPQSPLSVIQKSGHCISDTTGHYGPVPFTNILNELELIEKALLLLPITLQLNANGQLSKVSERTNQNYDKIEFGPCLYQTCTQFKDHQSDAGIILFNKSPWTGPVNSAYPNDSIIIFSIPVWENYMIYLTTDYITAGLQPCRAIFHFYPVKGNIKISSTAKYTHGLFTILRDTSNMFAGLTIAPQAMIQDGSKGNFAGQVIGRTYQWANPVDEMLEILLVSATIYVTSLQTIQPTESAASTIKQGYTETTTTLTESKKETTPVTHIIQLWKTKTLNITYYSTQQLINTINITDVTNVTATFTSYIYIIDLDSKLVTTTTTLVFSRVSSNDEKSMSSSSNPISDSISSSSTTYSSGSNTAPINDATSTQHTIRNIPTNKQTTTPTVIISTSTTLNNHNANQNKQSSTNLISSTFRATYTYPQSDYDEEEEYWDKVQAIYAEIWQKKAQENYYDYWKQQEQCP